MGSFRSLPQLLKFLDGSRPILFQQHGKRAVGEQFSGGLAPRTIIGLVVGVANALDRGAADRTRLPVLAVDRHLFTEGSDFGREAFRGFLAAAKERATTPTAVVGPTGPAGPPGPAGALGAVQLDDAAYAELLKR